MDNMGTFFTGTVHGVVSTTVFMPDAKLGAHTETEGLRGKNDDVGNLKVGQCLLVFVDFCVQLGLVLRWAKGVVCCCHWAL